MNLNEERIPPDQFQELIQTVHLNKIYLKSGNWNVNKKTLLSSNEIDISIGNDLTILNEEKVSFNQLFNLRLIPNGKKRSSLNIKCELVADFNSETKLDHNFWVTFGEYIVPTISIPFLREYVLSLTGKMDIPPILLPLWKKE